MTPVLPSPMPRGGKRPNAGRKAATPGEPLKARSGVPLTDAEWAAVLAYATAHDLRPGPAMRRLLLLALSPNPRDDAGEE